MYVWDTVSGPVVWDGGVAFTGSITVGAITGTLTNNNAAPGTNNFGVLPAVVVTGSVAWTAGNQSLLTVTTTGLLRVEASISTAGLATEAAQTDGSQLTQIVNTTGATIGIAGSPLVVSGIVTSGTVSITGSVTVANTGFAVLNAVNVTVSNTTVNVANTGFNVLNAVNATISNTTFNVANTTRSVVVTGIAYSNGVVSSTTQRVVNAALTPYTTAALTGNTATVSTVGVIVGAYMVYNPNASATYLQLFNANAVAATATNPDWVVSIPAASAANLAQLQLNFTTALIIKAATTFAGTTAPSSGLNVSLGYSVI